jgi:hypothetical protein
MKRDEIIATLRAYEPELRAAGVTRLALFGSVARNEAQVGSDIDLLAAFDAGREFSLLDIIGIENRLTDLIGHPVDLIEEGTLAPRVGKNVNREIVRAFWRRFRPNYPCHCETRLARRSNLVPGSLGGHEIASLRSQ